MRSDGTCEIAAGATLRVWVQAPEESLSAAIDAAPVPSTKRTPVDGGTQLSFAVPASARALVVTAPSATFRIALARASAPVQAFVEARALRDRGSLEEASALVSPLARSNDGVTRARALGLIARIALSRSDERGIDEGFADAIEADEKAGLASDLVDDAAAWTFSLLFRARFTEARRAIDRARNAARVYPEGQVRLGYYEASIDAALGHARRAMPRLREVAMLARRIGNERLARAALTEAARRSIEFGRAREGLDDLVALFESQKDAMSGCERADFANNIAWLALHVSGAPHGDPGAWVDRALTLLHDGCPAHDTPEWTTSLLGNRARAALDRGDLAAARDYLRDTRAKVPHPPASIELEWLAMDGELALAQHDLRGALHAYDAMAARAASVDQRDSQRLALERRADVLARMGDAAGAVAALNASSALTDAQSIEIPIGEGRESYLRDREGADARRIELLVSLGRPAQALAHLRRARARVLSALVTSDRLDTLSPQESAAWDEAVGAYRRERDAIDREASDDWRFSSTSLADRTRARAARAAEARRALEAALASIVHGPRAVDPPPPPEGELLLGLHAGSTQWIGFAAEADRVRAVPLGRVGLAAPPERIASQVLAPFAAEIARAHRVAVVAFGDARRLDVHALPFDGAPLIARVPVVYPLDAPHEARPRDAHDRDALVVGNPTSDLPSAHAEAIDVRAALAPTHDVTLLEGDDARGDAVRAALARASLFHYAGHGVFAGRDGWESALPLAEHAQLAISDVVALPRVPRVVVLGGCETARASGEAQAEGLGVAQAFVVAGADAAVAATRVVDDAAAAAMARALYAHLGDGVDVADAMRAADRELAAQGVKDWAAFRVLVP